METKALVTQLCEAAISAVLPENFIPKVVHREGSCLQIADSSFELERFEHIYCVSIGKAAVGMAEALDKIIHPYVRSGIVLAKHLPAHHTLGDNYQILIGGHPVPNAASIEGAEAILNLLEKAGERDLVIFLISGGGSALMTSPSEGIDLETYQAFCKAILGCGADIQEFNTLRKHLDCVKGGRLALAAAPAQQVSIILSDVVGSSPEVIASGPTVPDSSTYLNALDILKKYESNLEVPAIIRETLKRGAAGMLPETLKSNDPKYPGAKIIIAAENRTAAYAAAEKGRELGFHSTVINTQLTGEAAYIGEILPSFFSEMQPRSLLIFGGETTVQIRGKGLGGRNQELALASVRPMAERPGAVLCTLATDGEDGPTDAAGAIVTSDTLSKALAAGCDPDGYLRNNDSFHFFQKTDGLLFTGSTGTNVNDLTFLLKQ